MQIGLFQDQEIPIEFVCVPWLEMLSSLHVLADPRHHQERKSWVEKTEKRMSDELRDGLFLYGRRTDLWLIPMEFGHETWLTGYDIPTVTEKISRYPLSRWNELFRCHGTGITFEDKKFIIWILKQYYQEIFEREFLFLRPFMVRMLQKELELCRNWGIERWAMRLHNRLEVDEGTFIFHKDRDFRYRLCSPEKKEPGNGEVNKIIVTLSTFLSPHLMLYEQDHILWLTKTVRMEPKKDEVPGDLLLLFKALGDETRLKILRELSKSPDSTQRLSEKLHITEAGVSKQLKILTEAGLVYKVRHGKYVLYFVEEQSVDSIPYRYSEFHCD